MSNFSFISNTELSSLQEDSITQFLDKTERPLAYTNFEDEIGEVSAPESTYNPVNLDQYKNRIESYLLEANSALKAPAFDQAMS